ncbi:hypothetical protein KSX_08870 [Ktedonospora formicarum]|uniref:Uncharacterized protein n=1 Tax=Ktedonospora formicarum TaxID=2778364 RepID=A0A8J3HZE0_9CHLR|nr:hypothetical protein KSX_08870 [Ktedonospora formicarum]
MLAEATENYNSGIIDISRALKRFLLSKTRIIATKYSTSTILTNANFIWYSSLQRCKEHYNVVKREVTMMFEVSIYAINVDLRGVQ